MAETNHGMQKITDISSWNTTDPLLLSYTYGTPQMAALSNNLGTYAQKDHVVIEDKSGNILFESDVTAHSLQNDSFALASGLMPSSTVVPNGQNHYAGLIDWHGRIIDVSTHFAGHNVINIRLNSPGHLEHFWYDNLQLISSENMPPVANAGDDVHTVAGATVTVSSSDS